MRTLATLPWPSVLGRVGRDRRISFAIIKSYSNFYSRTGKQITSQARFSLTHGSLVARHHQVEVGHQVDARVCLLADSIDVARRRRRQQQPPPGASSGASLRRRQLEGRVEKAARRGAAARARPSSAATPSPGSASAAAAAAARRRAAAALDSGESSDSDSDDAVGVSSAGRAGALPSGVAGGREPRERRSALGERHRERNRLVAAEDVLGRSPQVGLDGAGPPPPPRAGLVVTGAPRAPARHAAVVVLVVGDGGLGGREPSLLRRCRVAAGEPRRGPMFVGWMGSRDTLAGACLEGTATRRSWDAAPRQSRFVVRLLAASSREARARPTAAPRPIAAVAADLSHTVTVPRPPNLGIYLITAAPAGS